MSNIKISSDLFLGTPELNRMQKFLTTDGYIQALHNNTVNYGLVKGNQDTSFSNGKVIVDSDINIGGNTFKTVKINPISGFDKNGNFLKSELITQLPIQPIGGSPQWFWIRVSHQYTHEERGLWSISSLGVLTSSNGELTKIARGQPNFPTRIRFTKDVRKYGPLYNTSDFDILSITDDNNAVLNGVNFQQEDNLKLNIVGTFTYGAPINPDNKLIFNYDSCLVELVAEDPNQENIPPANGYETGRTFYLARVRVDGSNLIVQDKRLDYWETVSSSLINNVEIQANPLIGIESIKYDHPFTTRNSNIVELAWTFRSTSWSINTSTNVITLSSGLGGKFKTITDFNDGDFDGWRLYTPDGKYCNIITSTRQGNAIDLNVDILDINSFSDNGGRTFIQDAYVVVAPNAEGIEITFTPNPDDNVSTQIQKFEFDINSLTGKCKVLAYKDSYCMYNVSYRYRNNFTYSMERTIPSDNDSTKTNAGYYQESWFDDNGNILPISQEKQLYTSDSKDGFIRVNTSPKSFKNFSFKVDKGDLIGMQKFTSLSGITTVDLIVGETLNYLYFTGNLSLGSDVVLNLSTLNLQDGNEFKIHFDCSSINLNGYSVKILSNSATLKTLSQADFYMMKNVDNGIVITAKSNDTSWHLSQNYDLGVPGKLEQILGLNGVNPLTYFDSNGWGNVKGLFGYHIADGSFGTVDLRKKFIIGQHPTELGYTFGKFGGSEDVKLTANQSGLREHDHLSVGAASGSGFFGTEGTDRAYSGSGSADFGRRSTPDNNMKTSKVTGLDAAESHTNMPPFYSAVFAQKMF